MEWQCLTHNNLLLFTLPLCVPLSSTHHFTLMTLLWLSFFGSLDLVIVVWKQRILMRRPPVPLLRGHHLRPETTPSGIAAATSQYLFFPSICVTHKLFYILFTPKIEFFQCAASGTISECGGFCSSCDQFYDTYNTVSNGTLHVNQSI